MGDKVIKVRDEYNSSTGRLQKVIMDHRQTTVTRYVIKNNGTKRIPCLYIEHTARTEHGGFVITSTEHCVKQTTGWARFCLEVEPEAELVLDVAEEATYEERLGMSDLSIAKFLNSRAKTYIDEKIMQSKIADALRSEMGRLRLQSLLDNFIRPANISEEHLITWEQRKCPWSAEPCSDPDAVTKEVRTILTQIRNLQKHDIQKKEAQRKQRVDNDRVKKIFQNQERLRENIRSMEHVRTGSLMERYMNDMDKEENDLIETRKRIEEAEESIAQIEQEVSKL